MQVQVAENEAVLGAGTPWSTDGKSLIRSIRNLIKCQSLAVGVIDGRKPQADEMMIAQGWPAAVVSRWCSTGTSKDKLVRAAMKDGVAIAYPSQRPSPSLLHRGNHVVICALPESPRTNRWWWLTIGRDKEAFTAVEQEQATLLLRRWQSRFALPDERQMGRLLIGHDDRLIAADLSMQEKLLADPNMLTELLGTLHRVIDQRFPDLADNQTRDTGLQVGKDVYWVVFRRGRAVQGADAFHYYIELRPLEADELPPVGSVKDDRIAGAIAFLHDHFNESPSLAQVSKHVKMSPFHFHRLFSKQVGVSPKHYLQRKQLQMAKWMLRALRVPIGSIAEYTGFSSHGHFTSTFHRLIGVSPTEYRESHY